MAEGAQVVAVARAQQPQEAGGRGCLSSHGGSLAPKPDGRKRAIDAVERSDFTQGR
jgi:hypothetical protein